MQGTKWIFSFLSYLSLPGSPSQRHQSTLKQIGLTIFEMIDSHLTAIYLYCLSAKKKKSSDIRFYYKEFDVEFNLIGKLSQKNNGLDLFKSQKIRQSRSETNRKLFNFFALHSKCFD